MVVIKDMKMPSCCAECGFCSYNEVIGYLCKATYTGITRMTRTSKRRYNCPLVEIEGHKVRKHTVQITIYGETHSVYKIIHKDMTMAEYYDTLREYYNPNREDIHVYLTKHWYSYENDIFYIHVYTTDFEKTLQFTIGAESEESNYGKNEQ